MREENRKGRLHCSYYRSGWFNYEEARLTLEFSQMTHTESHTLINLRVFLAVLWIRIGFNAEPYQAFKENLDPDLNPVPGLDPHPQF